jgi:hypothetical protein
MKNPKCDQLGRRRGSSTWRSPAVGRNSEGGSFEIVDHEDFVFNHDVLLSPFPSSGEPSRPVSRSPGEGVVRDPAMNQDKAEDKPPTTFTGSLLSVKKEQHEAPKISPA